MHLHFAEYILFLPRRNPRPQALFPQSTESVAVVKVDDWFARFATVAISQLQASSSSPDIVLSSETTFAIHIGISGMTSDDDWLAVPCTFGSDFPMPVFSRSRHALLYHCTSHKGSENARCACLSTYSIRCLPFSTLTLHSSLLYVASCACAITFPDQCACKRRCLYIGSISSTFQSHGS